MTSSIDADSAYLARFNTQCPQCCMPLAGQNKKVVEYASVIHLVCGHMYHDVCHDNMLRYDDLEVACRVDGCCSSSGEKIRSGVGRDTLLSSAMVFISTIERAKTKKNTRK